MESDVNVRTSRTADPESGVAIIGMAGRFPGAANVAEYWRNLCDGVESISVLTEEEILLAGVDPSMLANPYYVKAEGHIQNAGFFDAGFFGFGAREAEVIDPQQRVFLECAFEGLEDAGYDPFGFSGAIGVFAGSGMNTYGALNVFSNPEVIKSVGSYQAMLGNDKDFLATRVAYKLNLRGPAIGVQTACSTSLVAVQIAFESVMRGECDLALAGGVSIMFPQGSGYLYQPGMILSPDGHCRAFDADAAGTVPGRGAGVVVLKKLKDAIKDRDQIYAVIRGAAVNNDGSSKVGYSAPSVEGQSSAIRQSMQMAGFDAGTVSYIEGHGTGTEVGDPIELTALTRVFRETTEKRSFCSIGSVKTNIGHLDVAAGVAGLIKAALTLKYRVIPPTLHFVSPSPYVDWEASPFVVNTSCVKVEGEAAFRAGVSSFGIGGTNAHVSLEEPPLSNRDDCQAPQLLVFSAKSLEALDAQRVKLYEFLEREPDTDLGDISFTLQCGRAAFAHRAAIAVSSVNDAKIALRSRESPGLKLGVTERQKGRLTFLFPGQGSQFAGMTRGIYESNAYFREMIDECSRLLVPKLGLDLRDVLYPSEEKEKNAERLLDQTWVTQPALFVVEYSMGRLWQSLGLIPSAMLGHSIGEYVAACLAGVIELEDALQLVAMRGALIQSLPEGSMLAVNMSESEVQSSMTSEMCIAAVNSPGQTVISGLSAAIDTLQDLLRSREVECKRLKTSHAFHSSMMDPIVDKFVEEVKKVKLHRPMIPYVSNLTGTWITDEEATDPSYWGKHLRCAVQFEKCVKTLGAAPTSIYLEVGPRETLASLLRQNAEAGQQVQVMASLKKSSSPEEEYRTWLEAIGRMWIAGFTPEWTRLHLDSGSRRISLPTYQFQRQRYWIDAVKTEAAAIQRIDHLSDLQKQPDIADWFYLPSWKRILDRPLERREELSANSVWLVFVDEGDADIDSIVRTLSENCRVVLVHRGDGFVEVSKDSYRLRPGNPEDYRGLLRSLQAQSAWPARVLMGWLLAPSVGLQVQDRLEDGFGSLIALVQSIGDITSTRSVEIDLVSVQAVKVANEPLLDVTTSTAVGLCRVIPLESPNITCRVIDVDESWRLSNHLLRELASPTSNRVLAHRGSTRWIESLEAVRLEKAVVDAPQILDGGTYLITGGLGGVGLVLAEYLAKAARVNLVLVGRATMPDASRWNALIDDETISKKLQDQCASLRRIEQLGAEILTFSADTSDLGRMREIMAIVLQKFGRVDGIIHAAGVAGSGLLVAKDKEDALAVLRPKVQGSEWLREVIVAKGCDFAFLCSSISAIVPSFGLSAYAAANSYLDAFAAELDDQEGTRVQSVNWDTWGEVGMALGESLPIEVENIHQERLKHAMSSDEAKVVFERVLGFPGAQVLVSTRDAHALIRLAAAAISRDAKDNGHPGMPLRLKGHARPQLDERYVAPTNDLEKEVVEMWQELLGIDEIGIHDNFFELGGHSLLGTQMTTRIRERFKLDLPLRTVFEAPTPAELARLLKAIPWASGTNSLTPTMDMEREEIEF